MYPIVYLAPFCSYHGREHVLVTLRMFKHLCTVKGKHLPTAVSWNLLSLYMPSLARQWGLPAGRHVLAMLINRTTTLGNVYTHTSKCCIPSTKVACGAVLDARKGSLFLCCFHWDFLQMSPPITKYSQREMVMTMTTLLPNNISKHNDFWDNVWSEATLPKDSLI